MSRETIFMWERYGKKIKIDPGKKYLVYYLGCFCPPHKGHFGQISGYLKHENVKVIISQIGGLRHGVPKRLNRNIWKSYISDLLPEERVDLIQYDGYSGTDELLKSHEWFRECDYLIIQRGDEGDENSDTDKIERKTKRRWRKTIDICKHNRTKIIFYFSTRGNEKFNPSATKLCKVMIKYQDGLARKEDIYPYFPDKLSIKRKDRIIKALLECNLE